jgi:hypothetical protein
MTLQFVTMHDFLVLLAKLAGLLLLAALAIYLSMSSHAFARSPGTHAAAVSLTRPWMSGGGR